MKRIELKKIGEIDDCLLPEQIKIGFKIIEYVEDFIKPVIGQRFCIGKFDTCSVEEIIDENTFRTYGSIFKIRTIS